MARAFSFPSVKTLAVGDSTLITGNRAGIARKVNLYAKRAGREFEVKQDEPSFAVTVTRLPDPVKEAA